MAGRKFESVDMQLSLVMVATVAVLDEKCHAYLCNLVKHFVDADCDDDVLWIVGIDLSADEIATVRSVLLIVHISSRSLCQPSIRLE